MAVRAVRRELVVDVREVSVGSKWLAGEDGEEALVVVRWQAAGEVVERAGEAGQVARKLVGCVV